MATAIADFCRLLIGGHWIEASSTYSVRSPYDGIEIAEVAWGTETHAMAAIDAAERAMDARLPAHVRIQILERVAANLEVRKADFAKTIALEAGKPIVAAEAEVDRARQTLLFSASAARMCREEIVNLDAHPAGERKLGLLYRFPAGIVAAITPFNFPLNLVLHKIAPAFAAGCAVVLKPADKTPLSALFLGQLFLQAGLPPGWLNIIVGDAPGIADVFARDKRVKVISFTGSAEIGWKLRANSPNKKVLLELGNSTPLIILADADLERASSVIVANGFGFAGQTCISVQRVYAEHVVYDSLVKKLLEKIENLIVGDPLNRDTQVGPVITKASRDRLISWIRDAENAGAKVLAGGFVDEQGILRPTLLANVSHDADICSSEAFGPVVTIMPVSSLKEAVSLANATPYGLQAGLYTKDVTAALSVIPELEFAGITINESPSFRADNMPYGGVKASGNTREGPQYALDEYTERRLVVLAL